MDKKLQDAMNEQVTAEYQAALLYRQLAYTMEAQSFPGFASWFAEQAHEECDHAEKFATHLIDRGHDVTLHTVALDAPSIDSPLAAFKAALEHERKVSAMIRNIAGIADEVKDFDSRSLITWFLDEQIGEEATVSEIVDQLTLVGNDGSGLLRLDSGLGQRNDSSN
ncbi:ferritin [Corynebacterium sp. CCUG 51687]|uniref:ferritin n=1 Tax=Corynebacterium sp. CCUG 51687 TaxID=2823897 RepID=UPI00210EAE1F|nr:ferritin [Corynebacterium sp. CCUG 51687]MCQ4612046.1 ferritin [Corynebacterium sp. CCUG 51687]